MVDTKSDAERKFLSTNEFAGFSPYRIPIDPQVKNIPWFSVRMRLVCSFGKIKKKAIKADDLLFP